MQVDYDILIVGGGLVGASLACALAPLGYRIAVLEAVEPRAAEQPSYDDRTLALGQASCHILQGLGLWGSLQGRATAINRVTVQEPGAATKVVLDAGEMGLGPFGHVIEARAFGETVTEALETLEGVDVLCPARASALAQTDQGVEVTVDLPAGQQTLSAQLLVAADGARSAVRGLLGIEAATTDYQQVAMIANITPEEPHQGRAWEFLTATGPFALLPHVDGRCGLVWCVKADDQQHWMNASDDVFLAAARQRSGDVLGAFLKLGKRSSYPLHRVVPERDMRGRVLLLGNAAHAIHPVGAQGFNLGLRDVATLAEVLADAALQAREPPDPGQPALLEKYSHWRRPDQRSTMAWTHDMVGLFSSDLPLTRAARSAALLTLSLMPTARRRLACRAMGYRGRTPRLALGEALLPQWPEQS